jgi:lipoprotein-anchoring transpeptidase ErfK/SrfK
VFSRSRTVLLALLAVVAVVAVVAGVLILRPSGGPQVAGSLVVPSPSSAPAPAPSSVAPIPSAAPAPAGLPVLNYWDAPPGFPADSDQQSTVAATEGVHVGAKRALYDAPGGKPRAMLPPSISGVPLTLPVVERQPGWVAVLLPTDNRRVGWLPDTGWSPVTLHDQLILHRKTHKLTWLVDGAEKQSWTVATGTAATPTPLGRTFILGPTPTSGAVYAGLEALVLGSVPDHPEALSAGLQKGHTAIHSWYSSAVFGHSVSNGCIRMPKAAQQTLLANIAPGTELTVLD